MEESVDTPIPSSKPSNNKLFKILIIIIGFLIVTSLSLNAYLLFKKTKPITPTPISVIPTSTPIISETANWETYTNEKYGFSIKHPQNWVYNSTSEKEISKKGDSLQIIRNQISPFSSENSVFLIINIWENPQKLSTIEWLKQYQKEIKNVSVNAYVDKLPAFKDSSQVEAANNSAQRGGTAFPQVTYYVAKDENVYAIQLNNYSPEAFGYKNEEIYSLFDLIVSIFRFD